MIKPKIKIMIYCYCLDDNGRTNDNDIQIPMHFFRKLPARDACGLNNLELLALLTCIEFVEI